MTFPASCGKINDIIYYGKKVREYKRKEISRRHRMRHGTKSENYHSWGRESRTYAYAEAGDGRT